MTVEIHKTSPPQGGGACQVTVRQDQSGALKVAEPWHMPFVEGEIHKIRGWFEGFAALGVQGAIDWVFHEGLLQVSGKLECYNTFTFDIFRVLFFNPSSFFAALLPLAHNPIFASSSFTKPSGPFEKVTQFSAG
jgi:hypothetical protein